MSLIESLHGLGLLGLFFTAFLGHFSIVLKDVLFVPLFLYMSLFWSPLILGLVGGIGGGLGELGIYLVGRGVGKLTVSDADRSAIPSWAKRLGVFTILLSAITPLPDAPALLLLGSAHFPILPVLALEVVGKIILYTSAALAGGALYSQLTSLIPAPWDSISIMLASVGFSFLLTWKKTRTPIIKFANNTINKAKNALREQDTPRSESPISL